MGMSKSSRPLSGFVGTAQQSIHPSNHGENDPNNSNIVCHAG